MTQAPVDRPRIEAAVREILAAIGDDPARDGLAATPARVADAYAEFFAGLVIDPVALVEQGVIAPEPTGNDTDPTGNVTESTGNDVGRSGRDGDVVLVRDIRFRSVCEHHLLPFTGVAHVAYVPAAHIVGLGTLGRVVDAIASRPQLQERLGEQVADALVAGLAPQGVLVVLDAVHGCVTTRGQRQTDSSTVTVSARGVLTDPVRRAETMALVGAPRG